MTKQRLLDHLKKLVLKRLSNYSHFKMTKKDQTYFDRLWDKISRKIDESTS